MRQYFENEFKSIINLFLSKESQTKQQSHKIEVKISGRGIQGEKAKAIQQMLTQDFS